MKRHAWLGWIVVMAGCDPALVTDSGRIGLQPNGLFLDPIDAEPAPGPVVAGTVYCPEVAGYHDEDGYDGDDDVQACFDFSASGGAVMNADGCLELRTPGEAALELTPRACAAGSFEADRLSLEVVDASAVELRYDPVLLRDDIARRRAHAPVDAGRLFFGEVEIAIAADTTVMLPGGLRMAETAELATWNHGAFAIVAREGTPEILPVVDEPELADSLSFLPVGRVRTHEGDAVELVYEASGHRFVSAPIVASRVDEADSLELVAFYDTDVDQPATVHAIVTDTSGRRVVGAPIEWTLAAGLREGEEEVLSRDVLEIDGGCQGEARRAMVEASYGELSANLELAWSCVREEPDPFDDDDAAGEELDDDADDPLFGCSCRSTPSSGGGPLLLVIAGALAWRRRRRAPSTATSLQ